jgi:hypothetical protein
MVFIGQGEQLPTHEIEALIATNNRLQLPAEAASGILAFSQPPLSLLPAPPRSCSLRLTVSPSHSTLLLLLLLFLHYPVPLALKVNVSLLSSNSPAANLGRALHD